MSGNCVDGKQFHVSENKEGYYIAPTYLIYEDIPG